MFLVLTMVSHARVRQGEEDVRELARSPVNGQRRPSHSPGRQLSSMRSWSRVSQARLSQSARAGAAASGTGRCRMRLFGSPAGPGLARQPGGSRRR
jgi:hypothetical protein